MTGRRLFFLFAHPCAQGLLYRGFILPEYFQELQHFVNGGNPNKKLLTLCFPTPVKNLRKYAEANGGIEKMWSEKTVRGFWMRHKGETPVEVLQITSFSPVAQNICHFYNRHIAVNVNNLDLKVGDYVVTHNGDVIEKLKIKRCPKD